MKKYILSVLLLLPFFPKLYANENKMIIKIITWRDMDQREIVLFEGDYDTNLINKIKKSRVARDRDLTKDVIFEGTYFIYIYENDKITTYSIKSEYLVYNITTDILLKCSIVNELRGYLLFHIYKNDGAL
jgi:hypothetical protein